MLIRPRRLRTNEIMRDLTRETRISKKSLISPVFIKEGKNIVEDISSLENQKRYSPDKIPYFLEEISKSGIKNVLIFGIPEKKDAIGSSAFDENGVVQQAVRIAKKEFPEIKIITDVCLCEYTSHGHCGVLDGEKILNDSTLDLIAKTALSHAHAGADIVAPSDMMDNRVEAIRNTLEENKFYDTAIMSYSVKYSSCFYGPFREAAGSTPSFGDRKSYQMDYHNVNEAIKEANIDVEEGADILMVKPALAYLDVISKVKKSSNLPLAAYSVSGEYAMIKQAAKAGLLNEEAAICEITTSIYRAGADILITYFGKEVSRFIDEGRIG